MRLAITGVPGTGKTTLAAGLAGSTIRVVHLGDFAREHGLLGETDPARGSHVVDMDDLADRLNAALAGETRRVVLEGHFAHEMDVDGIVLLRCDPAVLLERLRQRGWSDAKVRENVEAEALDILAHEVIETGVSALELDVSRLSVEVAVARLRALVDAMPQGFKGDAVGTTAWSLESLPWF